MRRERRRRGVNQPGPAGRPVQPGFQRHGGRLPGAWRISIVAAAVAAAAAATHSGGASRTRVALLHSLPAAPWACSLACARAVRRAGRARARRAAAGARGAPPRLGQRRRRAVRHGRPRQRRRRRGRRRRRRRRAGAREHGAALGAAGRPAHAGAPQRGRAAVRDDGGDADQRAGQLVLGDGGQRAGRAAPAHAGRGDLPRPQRQGARCLLAVRHRAAGSTGAAGLPLRRRPASCATGAGWVDGRVTSPPPASPRAPQVFWYVLEYMRAMANKEVYFPLPEDAK